MSTVAVPNNKFSWLLKREFWEYRGAFFWTPAIVGMVMLGFVLFGLVVAEVSANRAGVNLNGMNFSEISKHLNEGNVAQLHAGLDIGMLGFGAPIGIALFFVLFSYGVGALYNDRADRSVLFWKSLPISDTETVLAKVVAMAVIAPVLAVGAMIALHLGFLVVMSLWLLAHGVNPLLLWAPGHLLALWAKLILLIPVNALWALPSIGWLLLVSSFVRSKPFLWALLVPVTAGVVVWMGHLMNSLSLPNTWFWKYIVGRLLLSLFPGSWMDGSTIKDIDRDDRLPEALGNLLSLDSVGHLVSTPNFLIGVAAGVAMIAGAIYFRLLLVITIAIGAMMIAIFGVAILGVLTGTAQPSQMGIAYSSAVVAVLLGFLFFLLLLLPLVMAIWFAPPLIMLGGVEPTTALKASFAGCLRNVLPFLVYGVIGLVLAIVATIPFGLGWFILVPVLIASIYASYCDIYEDRDNA